MMKMNMNMNMNTMKMMKMMKVTKMKKMMQRKKRKQRSGATNRKTRTNRRKKRKHRKLRKTRKERARREKEGGKFDQEDARDDAYLEVPAAAAFLDVLSHPHFVVGGPLVVEVRAPSADHAGWRARTKVREMSLGAS